MVKILQHTGNTIITAVIVLSLHFPLAYSYVHFFIDDDHVECKEYSKVHFHEEDVACSLYHTLKPGEYSGFSPLTITLFAPEYTLERPFAIYTFPGESSSIWFLRRGPPYVS